MHAWPDPRGGHIDRTNAAVRHGTAEQRCIKRPFANEIVDIASATGEEAEVFHAFDRAADQGVSHAFHSGGHSVIAASS